MADSPLDTLRAWMEEGIAGYTINWRTETKTADLTRWRAFRQSDKPALMGFSSWQAGRKYVIDPLPERISLAYADFLFNEPPLAQAASNEDQVVLTNLLNGNRWGSRLRVAEDICVSEREVWWRIYKDIRQLTWPILQWTSRINVVPYEVGETILACAFVTDLGKLDVAESAPSYRLIEYHEDFRVNNVLYEVAGSSSKGVGVEVSLEKHPVSAQIEEEWTHGLPMLAGRVKNEEWMTSIYDGIEDMLLELNETWSVDGENFRLSGKKRAVIDRKYAKEDGNLDPAEEILWAESDFNELDGGDTPFKILEYTYSANDAGDRLDRLERAALTRVGLARQLVDANASEGLAQTGTALRVRLMPTVAAIRGKAKEWADTLPKVIGLLQRVDAESPEYDHQWTNPEGTPSVVLQDPFPPDAQEDADRHNTLVSAELESIENALQELRPKWTYEQRMFEACRILANRDGIILDKAGNQITSANAGEFSVADDSTAGEGGTQAPERPEVRAQTAITPPATAPATVA